MSKQLTDGTTLVLAEFAQPVNSTSDNVTTKESYCIIGSFTVTTPTAKLAASAAVNTTNDTITYTAHGFKTGLKGQFTTSSALPAGLSGGVDYFVIVVDADTAKFATSLVNANAGTQVDITTQGTGNQTFTPTPLAGASAKVQISNDNITWSDLASSSQNITAASVFNWVDKQPGYNYVRVACTLTAGQILPAFTYAAKE
jgi:hypothetical protein